MSRYLELFALVGGAGAALAVAELIERAGALVAALRRKKLGEADRCAELAAAVAEYDRIRGRLSRLDDARKIAANDRHNIVYFGDAGDRPGQGERFTDFRGRLPEGGDA